MSTLQQHNIIIKESMTTPSRPGKQPRPVYEVTAPPRFDELMRELGAKKWKGAWSFWEDPTETLTDALDQRADEFTLERAFEYKQERKEAKAERLEGYAGNAKERAGQCFDQAHKMASIIPCGQPIHVGHHSEKADRRYRERIQRKGMKGVEEMKKAEHLEWKSENLKYEARRMESPRYLKNQIKKYETLVRRYQAYSEGRSYVRKGWGTQREISEELKQRELARMNDAQEHVDFLKGKLEKALAEKEGAA